MSFWLRRWMEQSRSPMQDERTRKAAEIAKLQEQLQESRKQQAADEGMSSEAASLAQQRADELAASQQKVASLEEKIGALQMEISRGREERFPRQRCPIPAANRRAKRKRRPPLTASARDGPPRRVLRPRTAQWTRPSVRPPHRRAQ